MNVEVKNDPLFDINKICRGCLTEKGEMRSVFLLDESIGQSLRVCDMLMGISNVQVEVNDGLPNLICMQCIHQVSQAFSFKQICEQSDVNLRTYLGKPILSKGNKEPETASISSSYIIDCLDFDDSSNDSDDSFKQDFGTFDPLVEPDNEKAIAQKQLIKAAKMQKSRVNKKKLLAKVGNKAALTSPNAIKKFKRNMNQCNVCKKQFINLKSFRKHLRSHIEDRPYKCKLCPRRFTEENYLNNHMRTHIPEDQKPYECKMCNRRFIHVTLLNKHMLKHSGEKPFLCKICNKGCYAENSLLKHMKIHEKKEGDPGLLKHICDYCKSEFPDAATLDVHIKQHTGDRPFVCNICGKCFPQRFNLELHLRTHTGERPFTCEVCKNGYVSKASLKIHMRTHTNERPFVCDFCGKAFRQSGDLTSHKRLHGTEKPIECSVCQKRFTTVMKLKYHMRNHTGERPYVCTVCGRGFTVNTILLRHMRVHSGERPYVCVTCGKAFSQSSTLNTHMKVHAPSSKYNAQETQQTRMPKYTSTEKSFSTEQKVFNPVETKVFTTVEQQMQNNRVIMPVESRMMQQPQDNSRLLPNDTRILDSHMLTDNRVLLNDNTRILGQDASRLLVNDNNRLMGNDNRLLTNDNRLISNMTDNNRMLNVNNENVRHLTVVEGSRILTDKYLTHYDPYHRGNL